MSPLRFGLRPALAPGLAAVLSGGLAACTQDPITVPVRSLERSGAVAFICLGAPGEKTSPGLRLSECGAKRAASPDDYGQGAEGEATLPHLYALVLQTTRGEVAVVDLTTETGGVLDQNPLIPGANFLPVGAQPVDVVATRGGTAAFVASAEVGRPGLFALPSAALRPTGGPAPGLTSWPACALPSAPGELVLVADPAREGVLRASCDGQYGEVSEAGPAGDLGLEGEGRQKLLVTLPEEGALAVVDAQSLLDRSPGSFDACPIERFLPLRVELPPAPLPPVPEPPEEAACVVPEERTPAYQASYVPRPAGLALSEGRLYVADTEAPVIHVLDVASPCELTEREPLLPYSSEDPTRVVRTSRLAASTSATPDLRRFLYAVDVYDGTAMVFDIGDAATSRTPIVREHPEWNPFVPRDRVAFGSPVQDIAVIERDAPQTNPVTGVAESGVRCSPDPALEVCSPTVASCDAATLYRTGPNFESGAGPSRLRGTFAFALLSSGRIAVVDVDDYDALCRGPRQYNDFFGCPPAAGSAGLPEDAELATSGEVSCNVVLPHQPRSATYVISDDEAGRNQPGLQSFPQLYDRTGTLVAADEPTAPRMRAVLPEEPILPPERLNLAVGGSLETILQDVPAPLAGTIDRDGIKHALAMNLEDPRVHAIDQQWSVVYEGALPGFAGKLGELRLGPGEGEDTFVDPNSRFCDAGVRSEAAVREELVAEGASPEEAASAAPFLADYVQISTPIPPEDDVYWGTPGLACGFQECRIAYGTPETPRVERDLRVVEAYQDRLVLGERPGGAPADDELLGCCFPSLVSFNVRGGNHWVVTGSVSGFLHHVVPDPETGACRLSCDPADARLTGRVRTAPRGSVVRTGDPSAFVNPMFRFAITEPEVPCVEGETCVLLQRDLRFDFSTQGAFSSLEVNLALQTADVQPQSISFVSPTGELAVTDGSLEGLFLVSTDSVAVSRQYF